VGDPASLLVIGEFVIEGIDGVTPKTREHINVFYNQLIMMMDTAGPSWQLMRKERYEWIKGVLVRLRKRNEVKHIRPAHPQCYKWCSAYALVNDGEGGFLLVIGSKNVIGFKALSKDADIDTVRRVSHFERAYADIKHHHGGNHCKGNTLLGCIGEKIDNIGHNCTKLFMQTCPICIQREVCKKPPACIKPIVTHCFGTCGQVDLIDFQLMPNGDL
jgi:hypothetical protein